MVQSTILELFLNLLNYDIEDILFELDGSGNVVTEYLHGPGIDEPIAMIRGGQTYYYHADGLGSIIAITDSVTV